MSWRYSLLPVVICRCLGPPASTRSSKMVACPRHDAVCCDGYVLPCHELSTSTSSELQRAPLLIFHANGFCGLAYAPMAKEIKMRKSFGFDLRGHGAWQVKTAVESVTYRQMAEDVIGWMEARNLLGKCFCFGHSLGGSVAGHIEILRPGAFLGVFLYEPVIFTPGMQGRILLGRPSVPDTAPASVTTVPEASSQKAHQGMQRHGCSGLHDVSTSMPTDGDASEGPRTSGDRGVASSSGRLTALEGCEESHWNTQDSIPGELVLAASALARQDRFKGWDDALAVLSASKPYKFLAREALEGFVSGGLRRVGEEWHLSCEREIEARIYLLMESQVSFQLFERMAMITCPVIVARGSTAKGVHGMIARGAPHLAAQVDNGTCMDFEGLYHLGPLEDPGRVARALERFMLDVESGQAAQGITSRM